MKIDKLTLLCLNIMAKEWSVVVQLMIEWHEEEDVK